MVILKSHIRELLKLAEKSGSVVEFVFQEILNQSCTDEEFRNKAITLMAGTTPENMSGPKAARLIAQARVILWVLGPVWVASDFTLPRVTGHEFRERLSNEPQTNWDEYFLQFRTVNTLWQDVVDDSLSALKDIISRIVVGRITRMFLDRVFLSVTA